MQQFRLLGALSWKSLQFFTPQIRLAAHSSCFLQFPSPLVQGVDGLHLHLHAFPFLQLAPGIFVVVVIVVAVVVRVVVVL